MNTKHNPLLKIFVSIIIPALILFLPLFSTTKDYAAKIKNFEELEKAIKKTREQLELNPEDADILCQLAKLMLMGGKYEAQQYLQRALEIESNHIESLLTLSELYRKQYRFEEGEKVLAKASDLAPEQLSVRLLQAKFAIDKMDFLAAETIYQDLLKKYPDSAEVMYGMANLLYWLNRFDESERFINKCLRVDPEFASAYTLYSRIHRIRQNNKEWKETGWKAVKLDAFDGNARASLASILVKSEGKLQEGYEQAKIALKLDPYSSAAHSYLGSGGTIVNYEEKEPHGDREIVEQIEKLLRKGDEYLLKGNYSEADKTFTEVLSLDPQNITAMIGKGTLDYHQKEFETALKWFFRVLDINPDYGLAHYGISSVLKQIKNKFNIKLAEIEKKFTRMKAPEAPYLRDVFINFDQIDPELQKIIRLSVASLSNYLKALKIAGATFYLIPFHKLLWQSPHHAHMKGKRTFDLRLWDDVKGLGGFHALTGAEWERDVKFLRFNVVTHEFTHQVHSILTKEQRKEIKRLFLKAKKGRRTLDYYADFNEWEYLAQGVEAYASEEKLADQKNTMGHTRQELLAKDPELYHFIENLNRRESYLENEIKAYIQKGGTILGKGNTTEAIKVYRECLGIYGSHAEVLNALGNAYRLQGKYDKAIKMHEQATREFPDNVSGYIGLAYDYFFIERDNLKAIELLKTIEKKHSDSFELLVQLGQLYYYAGDIDKMEQSLQQALNLDPSPDPYSSLKPYYQMAGGLLAKEDYAGAEKNLTFSLEEFDRNNPQAWAELAYIFLKTGREQEGEKHLNLALTLNQKLPLVKEIKATFLTHQGNTQDAQHILEKILEEYPRRIEARIQLAELSKESEPEKAEKLLADGLKLTSAKEPVQFVYKDREFQPRGLFEQTTVSRLYTCYADLLEEQGRIEEAIGHHKKALKLFKYSYNSAVALVRLYKQTGKLEDTRKTFEELKNTNPPAMYLQECEKLLKDEQSPEDTPSQGEFVYLEQSLS